MTTDPMATNNARMQRWLIQDRWLPLLSGEDPKAAVELVLHILASNPRQQLFEVALRSPKAIEAIRLIKSEVPHIKCGGGTVLETKDLLNLHEIGADFAVSPGFHSDLALLAVKIDMAYLPAVMSPSEIMAGLQLGYQCFKFFPAEAAGSVPMLQAFSGPFPRVRFCPTGGISKQVKDKYLALKNVIAVGGSVKL